MPALYVAGDTNKDHLCVVLVIQELFRIMWKCCQCHSCFELFATGDYCMISQVQPTVLGGCSYTYQLVVYSSTGHCHND